MGAKTGQQERNLKGSGEDGVLKAVLWGLGPRYPDSDRQLKHSVSSFFFPSCHQKLWQ